MNYYLRIGELPQDGKSKIYQWDDEEHSSRTAVGEEKGISVYPLVYNGFGGWSLDLTNISKSLTGIDTFRELSKAASEGEKKMYLVTGNKIGTGLDNEPLLKNVIILSQIEIENEIIQEQLGVALGNPYKMIIQLGDMYEE